MKKVIILGAKNQKKSVIMFEKPRQRKRNANSNNYYKYNNGAHQCVWAHKASQYWTIFGLRPHDHKQAHRQKRKSKRITTIQPNVK